MEEKRRRIKSKYAKLSFSIFAAGAGVLLLYYLLYNTKEVTGAIETINSLLTPFYIGIILAYLLCPIYNRILRGIYRANKGRFKTHTQDYRLARLVASIVSFTVLLFAMAGFVMLIVPELVSSIIGLVGEVPGYIDRAIGWVQRAIVENPELALILEGRLETLSEKAIEWGQANVIPGAEAILTSVSVGIMGTFSALVNFLVSLIVCLYVLNSKEIFQAQAKKFILAVFPRQRADKIFEFANICEDTFGGFINGKIIDSIIIGIICFIAMNILGLPMAVLISVVIGLTNIIPFFGPFIGAIPSVILLLFIDPWAGLEFGIMILVLQQVDGNIIGPKILGKTTKLASFWVLFAIIVGGGLFGFVGLILGVPTMAVIYIYLTRSINDRLAKRNLSTKTAVYENFDKYDINKEEIFGKDANGPIENPEKSD